MLQIGSRLLCVARFRSAINLSAVIQQMLPRSELKSESKTRDVLLRTPFNKSILHWHLEILGCMQRRWIRKYNCLNRWNFRVRYWMILSDSRSFINILLLANCSEFFRNFVTSWNIWPFTFWMDSFGEKRKVRGGEKKRFDFCFASRKKRSYWLVIHKRSWIGRFYTEKVNIFIHLDISTEEVLCKKFARVP